MLRQLMTAALLLAAGHAAAQSSAAPPARKDQGDRASGAAHATRSPALGVNGMAATSHPLATGIALDVLKAGGSAVDAAIAANAALGLMEPTGNGIGGDLFAIVWDPRTAKLHGLNASGRAPLGQSLDQLRAANKGAALLPPHGWMPVTVPGAVDGWFELHARFGRRTMAQNLEPAIAYAERGFPVTQYIGESIERSVVRFEAQAKAGVLQEAANMARVYAPGGTAPGEGALFRNPDLARSYRALAAGGRDAFYKGDLARAMDGYFRRIGAPHRLADFAAHKSEWIDPVSVNYRGYDVYELPPPGQGIAALQMLNMLEPHDLKAMGRASPDFWHLMVEAKKLAFADRAAFYADVPDVRVTGLLAKDYAAERARLIDMTRAARRVDAGAPRQGDTIYLTTADKDGMMVSLIQSNYRGMGSGLVPDDGRGGTLGFMFQDRGQQFSLQPGQPNSYAPGKRPFHTIIPAFVMKDGKPWMSFGLMGGGMQPQGHVQVLVNMIDFGMNVQEAGDAARFHHDGSTEPDGTPPMADGGVVELESGVPATVADDLRRRGHQVVYTTGPFGGHQAIMRDPATGIYWGASEFRKDGHAAGY